MECASTEPLFLSHIGLMMTYKCTAACPHCVVQAGPRRKEEMRLDDAQDWIEQAQAYRDQLIEGLALTGGEPFYNLDLLKRVSDFAVTHGLIVSVSTNAFWAETRAAALETLKQLAAIQILSFSTDAYHQKTIPFAYIQNAIAAARELDRFYTIAVCTDSTADAGYERIVQELRDLGEQDHLRLAVTFPVGRAKANAHQFNYRMEPEPSRSACLTASVPIIFPDGRVLACIGPLLTLPPRHPMYLGSLREEPLAQILDRAELNPILHALRLWGPFELFTLLKQNGMEPFLPREYIADCICDACFKLLSDEHIVAALERIVQKERYREILAYGRIHYLKETRMAELYHLNAPRTAPAA